MKNKKTRSGEFSDERVEAKATNTSVSDSLKDLGSSALKSLWEDLLSGSAKKVPEQIFKTTEERASKQHFSGELEKNQEINLKKNEQSLRLELHREYFNEVKFAETRKIRDEQKYIEKRVEEILIELKKLAKSSKEIQVLFKEITIEEMPVKAGTYHINFFEWVLSVVRNARMKVEEGASWMSMFSSKKRQKEYWSMFKKHGTTFGLSQERTMATQTG